MSEIIDNSRLRKDLLKEQILKLHKGEDPEVVRGQLVRMIGQIPYGDVVQVEQELIAEGLPQEEVLRLCDVHTAALRGQIDLTGMKPAPAGHPVHTFMQENRALEAVINAARKQLAQLEQTGSGDLLESFRALAEVDRRYRRKENLLFPFLEKKGITGPPTVMWGKHDQIRDLLKTAIDVLESLDDADADEVQALVDLSFAPALDGVADMIMKEEQILFPMCLDLLADTEWAEIAAQSGEIGFCLFTPTVEWTAAEVPAGPQPPVFDGRVMLPSGSFRIDELTFMLNALPCDITYIDADDAVRYFSQGKERIFDRNSTILGRKVQLCHPPSSVHMVNRILDDFKSGRQDMADFWINFQGKFVYISYYAVRDEQQQYLGTVEFTMNLTRLRALQGEQRLLNYANQTTTEVTA